MRTLTEMIVVVCVAAALLGAEVPTEKNLTNSLGMTMVRVEPGGFALGSEKGQWDERPVHKVRIARPFYLGVTEVTNAQYEQFDPGHRRWRGKLGYSTADDEAVVFVSWEDAVAFCRWLSNKEGRPYRLPTEAEWEYACRAGTSTPMWYGTPDANFAKVANFADERLNALTRRDSPKWIPTFDAVNDGDIVTANVDKHQPNPWGLVDMHGNVAEWTRSLYKPYPYRGDDGRDALDAEGMRVVRGGSFYDRPARGRSAFRWRYRTWQKVYNVGFRVVVEDGPPRRVASGTAE